MDEVEWDDVPLDVCVIFFGSPYMWDSHTIFLIRGQKYRFFKNGNPFPMSVYKGKQKISHVTTNQLKRLINVNRNILILVLKPRADGMGLEAGT